LKLYAWKASLLIHSLSLNYWLVSILKDIERCKPQRLFIKLLLWKLACHLRLLKLKGNEVLWVVQPLLVHI